MRLEDLDYPLPPERIAQVPLADRSAARLLVDRGAGMAPGDRSVRELPDLLGSGDLVVVNESRVIPARLRLRRRTGGAVEVLLLETSASHGARAWSALVRPGRKMRPGEVLLAADGVSEVVMVLGRDASGDAFVVELLAPERHSGDRGSSAVRDRAVLGRGDGGRGDGGRGDGGRGDGDRAVRDRGVVRDRGDSERGESDRDDGRGVAERFGEMPLPPYIHEPLRDPDRYQTVYATTDRTAPPSAAAPTAGLHFTPEVLSALAAKGIDVARVDLAVGLDTFQPVTEDDPLQHRIHTERYSVPEDLLERCRAARRVVAVGTTAVRALETAATTGEMSSRTGLFIHRGYEWKVVDVMLTNFHMPRTSLLLMVDAFVGPRWRDLYAHAVAQGYRFLSFGDAMLLQRDR